MRQKKWLRKVTMPKHLAVHRWHDRRRRKMHQVPRDVPINGILITIVSSFVMIIGKMEQVKIGLFFKESILSWKELLNICGRPSCILRFCYLNELVYLHFEGWHSDAFFVGLNWNVLARFIISLKLKIFFPMPLSLRVERIRLLPEQ